MKKESKKLEKLKQVNPSFTGQQGTGKTTMLKAALQYVPSHRIHIQELKHELK